MWKSFLWSQVFICTRYLLKHSQLFITWWNWVYFLDNHFVSFMSDKWNLKGKINVHFLLFFFFFWTGFLILDWNHLCGKTAQRTQTSEEGEHKNHKRNPQELWEGAAWGNTHLHKLHYAWSYWGSFWWLIGDLFTWVLLQALTTFWVRQSGVWC